MEIRIHNHQIMFKVLVLLTMEHVNIVAADGEPDKVGHWLQIFKPSRT